MKSEISFTIPGDPIPWAATDDDLISSYKITGSVWKTGSEFGISGQSVHKRLSRIDGIIKDRSYSRATINSVIEQYEKFANKGIITELANNLSIDKHNLCRLARKLGLTNKHRKRPRGSTEPRWSKKDGDGLLPHPRGMLGKFHKKETKNTMSIKTIKNWETWRKNKTGPMSEENLQKSSDRMSILANKNSNPYSRCKYGKRIDIGDYFFRSAWEANYARYLNLLIRMKIVDKWEFEPETFWFEKIKRGIRSYKPDFKVWYKKEKVPVYVEVKGWMDSKSKTKIKRFKKYFPQHKLEIVDQKAYKVIKSQWSKAILNWE